jgi:hypothetical protein
VRSLWYPLSGTEQQDAARFFFYEFSVAFLLSLGASDTPDIRNRI